MGAAIYLIVMHCQAPGPTLADKMEDALSAVGFCFRNLGTILGLSDLDAAGSG